MKTSPTFFRKKYFFNRTQIIWISLVFITFESCRTPKESLFYSKPSFLPDSDLADVFDAPNDGPENSLDKSHRRNLEITSECGYDRSIVKPFIATGDGKPQVFFDEEGNFFRSYARPALMSSCKSDEKSLNGDAACWRDFGLQFYPNRKTGVLNHFRVGTTSPIIRVLPRVGYPRPSDWCKFDNDTALIWAAGVGNPSLGISWENIDNELLASIIGWNRNTDLPQEINKDKAGHGKLSGLPGYVQIVGNSNTAIDGINSKHNEQAISLMLNNIILAYRSGVRQLEIVSHSNGMITTQIALRLFAEEFKQNRTVWEPERASINPKAGKMKLHVYHLQAAPGRKWSFSELDRWGSVSDFLPNAVWVKKSAGPVNYWGWDWNFSTYDKLAAAAEVTIRYYYNRPDWKTFDVPSGFSSVGRNESLAWQKEFLDHTSPNGYAIQVRHYSCPTNDYNICGPDHSQKNSLWDFVDPSFLKSNQKPMPWQADMSTSLIRGSTGDFSLDGSFLTQNIPVKYAQSVCVDVKQNASFCGAIMARFGADPNKTSPGGAMGRDDDVPEKTLTPIGVKVPIPICSEPLPGQNDPCNKSVCGDGVCGFGESRSCPSDCTLPSDISACICKGGTCSQSSLTCKGFSCSANSTFQANECGCQIPRFTAVKCSSGNYYCEVVQQNGHCTKTLLEENRNGTNSSEICTDDECLATKAVIAARTLPESMSKDSRLIRTKVSLSQKWEKDGQ